MATTEEQLSLVEGLARIAREFRLDAIQLGELRIVRTQHEPPAEPRAIRKASDADEDEDLLFHSADA